jgi:hypothetical protein
MPWYTTYTNNVINNEGQQSTTTRKVVLFLFKFRVHFRIQASRLSGHFWMSDAYLRYDNLGNGTGISVPSFRK